MSRSIDAPSESGAIRLVEEVVVVAGDSFRIQRPPSAEDLIDEREYEQDERLPYWAELWPSARALAEVIAERDVRASRVLELGCGLGLPSLLAARRGARVVATDWYEAAVDVVRINAVMNNVVGIEAVCASWDDAAGPLHARAPFDVVIAADVLYEERHVAALARLIPTITTSTGTAIVVDPRRPYAQYLAAELTGIGWTHTRSDRPVSGRVDEQGPVVHVYEFHPPNGTR